MLVWVCQSYCIAHMGNYDNHIVVKLGHSSDVITYRDSLLLHAHACIVANSYKAADIGKLKIRKRQCILTFSSR